MKTNTNLELTVPLDILLTPENISLERIVDILKGSNHFYFNDAETDIETGISYISYNMGYYFIRLELSQSVIQVFTYDRLKNEVSNAELLKLINMVGANYSMINCLVYDERHRKEPLIDVRCRAEIVFRGGISETAFVESIKLFTSEYIAMRAMYMVPCLYEDKVED